MVAHATNIFLADLHSCERKRISSSSRPCHMSHCEEKYKLSVIDNRWNKCLTWYDLWWYCCHLYKRSCAAISVASRIIIISMCIASWPLCFACSFSCSILSETNTHLIIHTNSLKIQDTQYASIWPICINRTLWVFVYA